MGTQNRTPAKQPILRNFVELFEITQLVGYIWQFCTNYPPKLCAKYFSGKCCHLPHLVVKYGYQQDIGEKARHTYNMSLSPIHIISKVSLNHGTKRKDPDCR